MLTAPTLETQRLILRAHRKEDLPESVAMWSDPEITRYTIGAPATEQRTWIRLMSYLGHWQIQGFGYWAVEDKASRRYIGEMGFADFKRGAHPSMIGVPELGWVLASQAQGKGLATEGLRAAVEWADRHFPDPRTVCIINPANLPSLRVAAKIGYREFARGSQEGIPEIFFERGRAG